MARRIAKSERMRLAKAELLLHLAMSAQRWADEVTDKEPGDLPFDQWPFDDPMRVLAKTYRLTGADLGRICTKLGAELEARAERAGYSEAWVDGRGPVDDDD